MKNTKGKRKVKCVICGEVELPTSFCGMDGEGVSIPTVFAPTILHLGKRYAEIEGNTYEYTTGNKITGSFGQKILYHDILEIKLKSRLYKKPR